MITIHIEATMPDERAEDFAKHMRAYDKAHPGHHFKVWAVAPDLTNKQVEEMLIRIMTLSGITRQ